jgi:fatty acid desaturase
MAVDPDRLHLLLFEKRLVEKAQRAQLKRLQAESPRSPEENERSALARALIACRAVWGLIGILFVLLGLVLQLTAGLWCLIGWMGLVACIGMNLWRRQQSKRLLQATAG